MRPWPLCVAVGLAGALSAQDGNGGGFTMRRQSHTDSIHRLAAAAILAIAAPDDPLVARAQDVLRVAAAKR